MRPVSAVGAALSALFVICFAFLGCNQVGGNQQIKLPSNPKAGDRLVIKAHGAKLTFRYCPPGEFTMNVIDFSDRYLPDLEEEEDEEGNVDVPEKPIRVKITRGFWIQETELTREQAFGITGKKEYARTGYDDGTPAHSGNYPFWGSRYDFEEILKKLNVDETVLKDDMTPYEKLRPDGWKFELPTEAEWEYASRAGTNDPEPDEESDIYVWSKENSGEVVHKVASKKANKWGLYDMRGHMWERVRIPQDNTSADMPDQQIFDEDGTLHDPDNLRGRFEVLKGGGLGMTVKDCKSGTWSYYEGRWSPRSFQGDVGGRLVLVEEASVLKPDRKQLVRESGFARWRRQTHEESQKHFEEFHQAMNEQRKREREAEQAAREANPDAFKTAAQRAQEHLEQSLRESREAQEAMERREIEVVMRENKMTEEQAKEFIAQRKAEAQKANEEFDKKHGLDSIEDPIERARRRADLHREEIDAARKKMLESNPQLAEIEKRAEENRKKFEERREANRKKFDERRKQMEKEMEESQKEMEKMLEEMRNKRP